MDTISFARFVVAFLIVLGLIGILWLVLRKMAQAQLIVGAKNPVGRLQIVETRFLDPKRRLVLIKRDKVEHLLLLSDGHEIVVESGIETHE